MWDKIKTWIAAIASITVGVLAILLGRAGAKRDDYRRDFERTREQLAEERANIERERAAIAEERRKLERASTVLADDRAVLERARDLRRQEVALANRDRRLLEELQRRSEMGDLDS